MFITKKQYEAAIREAKDEAFKQCEQQNFEENERRYMNDRFKEVHQRMSTAFGDIDRRLNSLEESKRKVNEHTAVLNKY